MFAPSNRRKDIFNSEKGGEKSKKKIKKNIKLLPFSVINIPFKRTIRKLPGWKGSLP